MSGEDLEILLPGQAKQRPARRAERRADAGVAANARLTATNAAALLVLLAAEGITILRVRALLTPHVFIWLPGTGCGGHGGSSPGPARGSG